MFRRSIFLIVGFLFLFSLTGCKTERDEAEPTAEPVFVVDFAESDSETELPPTTELPPEEEINKLPEEAPVEQTEGNEETELPSSEPLLSELSEEELVLYMENKYGHRTVRTFGENIEGVYTSIDTNQKIIALTFDACGGVHGSGYDEELITYLIEMSIPATLFVNRRWMEENKEVMKMLAQNDLFEIENHGYAHKPLSVDGRSAYGIKGTEGIKDVIDEIMMNQEAIASFTGRSPIYFRSGTAHYDDIALDILNELDLKAVNFDVLGDAGATFNKEQMIRSARGVKNGSIILYHMNHPHREIAEAIKTVVPMLMDMGYDFVKLSDYDDYLK
ncbi:MAG TPA: polysaccharide deacetylase family protein [Bacteroidales bacterium]|nr:polysaccharide deacetylase family protein [Bacteroidales bacterium]